MRDVWVNDMAVEVAYNGKLIVVVTRKGKELNILVKLNSYKPLIILVGVLIY